MKIPGFLFLGMTIVMVSTARAGPPDASGDGYAQEAAHLKKHEKKLERMQADRSRDNEHTRQTQKEFRKSTAELSDDDEQQLQDVQELRSVERQVTAGQAQKTVAHQSYKETMQKYGSGDPRSAAAKESWKESKQALHPLLQNRRTLNSDIQKGRRLVHNDKVILGVQKRGINSDARYRAIDDRKIRKEEKNIADDHRAMTQTLQSSERARSK